MLRIFLLSLEGLRLFKNIPQENLAGDQETCENPVLMERKIIVLSFISRFPFIHRYSRSYVRKFVTKPILEIGWHWIRPLTLFIDNAVEVTAITYFHPSLIVGICNRKFSSVVSCSLSFIQKGYARLRSYSNCKR